MIRKAHPMPCATEVSFVTASGTGPGPGQAATDDTLDAK